MKSIDINWNAIHEIAAIQQERKLNWSTGEPRDLMLEHRHRERLDVLRDQLSAQCPDAAGTSETPTRPGKFSSGLPVPVGNPFTRFIKRIFRNAEVSDQ